jgi:hypothetical protein
MALPIPVLSLPPMMLAGFDYMPQLEFSVSTAAK